MLDVAKVAVEAAVKAGADYADARVGTDLTESITVRNQEMEGIDRSESTGLGIRVLVNGRWGFAATARLDEGEIDHAAATGRPDRQGRGAPARRGRSPLARSSPSRAPGAAPMNEDPFTVPLEEKVALLMEATRRMQAVPGVTFAEGGLDLFRRSTWFASSEGAAIDQVTTHSGGGIEATAIADGEVQRRSFPNSFRGHVKASGYEHIRTLGLVEEAERTGTAGGGAAARRPSARARSRR